LAGSVAQQNNLIKTRRRLDGRPAQEREAAKRKQQAEAEMQL